MRSTAEEQHELYKQKTPHRQANGRPQPSTDVKVWERRWWHNVEALTGPVDRETNDLNHRQPTFSRSHGIVIFVRPPVVWISLTATNSSTILGPPRFPLLDIKWTIYAFIATDVHVIVSSNSNPNTCKLIRIVFKSSTFFMPCRRPNTYKLLTDKQGCQLQMLCSFQGWIVTY